MHIVHLTPSRAGIRNVFGLTTTRQRINALRDCLAREEKGQETVSKDSSGIMKPSDEIIACGYIYEDILSRIDEAANKPLETSIRAYIGGNSDHNNWDK